MTTARPQNSFAVIKGLIYQTIKITTATTAKYLAKVLPQTAKHIYICLRCGSSSYAVWRIVVKKLNWNLLEQWATEKYRKFATEYWLDLLIVREGFTTHPIHIYKTIHSSIIKL